MPTPLAADSGFARYCCELLAAIGPCHAYRMFGGLGLRTADGLVVVAGIFRDRALAAHGTLAPTIITPNAANIDKFTFTQAQRDETRKRFGLEGHVVCGYLGAFVPWHAIDQFVYKIADRLKANPQLKLLLVVEDVAADGD